MRKILCLLFLVFTPHVTAYDQDRDSSGSFYTNTAFGLCQVTGRYVTSLARQTADEGLSHKAVMEHLVELDDRYASHFDELGFKLEDQEPEQGVDSILELAAGLSSGDLAEDLLYKLFVWECIKETKIGLGS